MKKIIYNLTIIALAVVTFTACEDVVVSDTVEVRFENVSTYDLENVKIREDIIGDLEAGEITEYQVFENIGMSQNRPSIRISAMFDGVELYNNNYCIVFCGTGLTEEDMKSMYLQPGKYTITIDVEEAEAEQNISGYLYIDIRED